MRGCPPRTHVLYTVLHVVAAVAAYAIGDELNDDNQNPVVYHRDKTLITV